MQRPTDHCHQLITRSQFGKRQSDEVRTTEFAFVESFEHCHEIAVTWWWPTNQ